jgi:trimethylamine--corrinoid protein Co-methyltransferase
MSVAEQTAARRVRGGGGAARRAERSAISFETARFIERNIPNFEILTPEAIEIIEANAETVLEEIGVNFVDNPGALARWRDAGADVRGERVHIPRGLARKLCATAPAMLKSGANRWCWPPSMARPSCAIRKAGGAMRPSPISRCS